MRCKVSVIIPNYNYAKYLNETIESVLSQSCRDVEVIVVDDGSTDNSLEILKAYGDRIKVITQKNAGVAAARNNGVAHSSGEFIAFLDADDVFLPEKLARQIEKFEKDPALGLVFVGVEHFDDRSGETRVLLDGMEGNISRDFLLYERETFFGGGSGAMVQRHVFDEVGGFDTSLSTSADWDFYYRVSARYTVGFVREVLLRYRLHGSNMRGNLTKVEREMKHIFKKAYAEDRPEHAGLMHKSYGNLYKVLAWCYLEKRDFSGFLSSAAKSIANYPANLLDFAAFPFGYLKRKIVSFKTYPPTSGEAAN